MGLCFSIPEGIKVPPSLTRMFKAMNNDAKVDFNLPKKAPHGNLTKWTE